MYGRRSRCATCRVHVSMRFSSPLCRTSGRPAARASSSTVRSSCVGPRPPEMTSRSCSSPSRSARSSPSAPSPTMRTSSGSSPSETSDRARYGPLRSVRSPRTSSRARDEDRAARAAQPAFQPVGVTVITRGRRPRDRDALASDRDHEVLRRADVEPVALAPERDGLALLDRALEDHDSGWPAAADRDRRGAAEALDDEIRAGRLRDVLLRPAPSSCVFVGVVAAGRLPGADHDHRDDHDRGEHEQDDDASPSAGCALLRPRRRRASRALAVVGDEARVELVDVELAVEAEVVGIRAEEALDVGLGREQLEALLLE